MKQIAQLQSNGAIVLADVPAPAARDGFLVVRTAYSLISAGTERAKREIAKKSLLGKALARPDQVRTVIDNVRTAGLSTTIAKVRSRLESLSPLGYSLSGIVIEAEGDCGGLLPGDLVACAGAGFANHAEIVAVPKNLAVRVPAPVSLAQAAYATVGAIAMQGVRQAGVGVGEVVGVSGLGLVGLLTVQILRAAGCRVVGIEPNSVRRSLALRLGADAVIDPGDSSADQIVRQYAVDGLDAVVLTAAAASSEPVQLAAELLRDRGRVVVVGDVGLDLDRNVFYEKELDLRLSRSYGPGRYDANYEEHGHDYPIGYIRWSEQRNLASFLDLVAQGKIDVTALTTHTFAIEEYEAAYALIEGETKQPYLGVLFDYGVKASSPSQLDRSIPVQVPAEPRGDVGIALIGAGSFAQSMLVPPLRKRAETRLRTAITSSGLTARSVADRNGFERCGSDPQSAFDDPEVRLVVIATRHDSHAALVRRAIESGKPVFVEKPLALNRDQLNEIVGVYQERQRANGRAPFVMVGFNRRFAPLALQMRHFFEAVQEPKIGQFRINAGYIPANHWTQDPRVGGGRIIGELCHFLDFAEFAVGSPLVEVSARALPDTHRYTRDNVAVACSFEDQSQVTVTYLANGAKAIEKERFELFGGGRAAILDDFRVLTLAAGSKKQVAKSGQDKGHQTEMAALVDAVRAGQPSPVPFASSVRVTEATFAVLESLADGLAKPVLVR